MAAKSLVLQEDDYSLLKNLNFEVDSEDGTFSLCLWVYLLNSTSPSATIIQQVHSDIEGNAPFLVLDQDKKLTLYPLLFLHEEAPKTSDSTSWTEVPCVSAEVEFPLAKWVHVGCEVSTKFVRLHIDGVVVGEKPLSSFSKEDSKIGVDEVKKLTLAGADGVNGKLHGYVHYPRILPVTSSINGHFVENPPLELSIDNSCVSEIEDGGDGVWNIVGGKASCRRNFSVDVVLLDAFGNPVNMEMEVVASLQYADNGLPVDKPNDAEASLLTSYDGIEFASSVRPSKLLQGRASFKLKISQLSSKCDNRLFRLRFDLPKAGRYPFLEAYSNPVRCISRSRNTRTTSLGLRRSVSSPLDGPQPLGLDAGSPENQLNAGYGQSMISSIQELKSNPNPKRVKVGGENLSMRNQANPNMEHPDGGNDNQGDDNFGANDGGKPENLDVSDNTLSDSESVEATKLVPMVTSITSPISDMFIFKYCLGSMNERCLMLKELATSATDQEITNFSQLISTFTGCSHHRYQISMAKRLVHEGNDAWDSISKGNLQVLWQNAILEIEQQFMKISRCNTRCLKAQDFELLREIAGCRDYLTWEKFDKMWYWLYPVAFTLSRDCINAAWGCMSPKWIEGLITKDEAENSLRDRAWTDEPGTYILRFPTSRSWPHPDAGSLVVSYVGPDHLIHHRFLSIDWETNKQPLQALIRAEPQLTVLGRVSRNIAKVAEKKTEKKNPIFC